MTVDDNDQFKMDRKDELKQSKDNGGMDLCSEKQSTLPPNIDNMKGLKNEMIFEYLGVDGAKCLDWYQGKMIKVIHDKKFGIKIEWDEITLAESDVQFIVQKLVPGNWNPKKIIKGGWRDYIAY